MYVRCISVSWGLLPTWTSASEHVAFELHIQRKINGRSSLSSVGHQLSQRCASYLLAAKGEPRVIREIPRGVLGVGVKGEEPKTHCLGTQPCDTTAYKSVPLQSHICCPFLFVSSSCIPAGPSLLPSHPDDCVPASSVNSRDSTSRNDHGPSPHTVMQCIRRRSSCKKENGRFKNPSR